MRFGMDVCPDHFVGEQWRCFDLALKTWVNVGWKSAGSMLAVFIRLIEWVQYCNFHCTDNLTAGPHRSCGTHLPLVPINLNLCHLPLHSVSLSPSLSHTHTHTYALRTHILYAFNSPNMHKLVLPLVSLDRYSRQYDILHARVLLSRLTRHRASELC